MVFLEEFIKLRTEQTRELTHLELDRNLQYVANPWNSERKYLEGMIVYYSDSTTGSTSGLDDLTWFRANKNNGPSAFFDPSDWDPIGASSISGEVIVKDSGGIFNSVGVIEFDSNFTVNFLGSTSTISIVPGAFSVWQPNSIDPTTIYYTDDVLIGTDTIINPSYKLSVAGNAIITGNLDVSGLIDGVDLFSFYTDYNSHTHTIVSTSLAGYAASYPNSNGQLADVLLTSLADGEFLSWNASLKRWVNTSITVGSHALGDHSDVANSVSIAPSNNQVLVYNSTGSEWENRTLTLDGSTGFVSAPFAHNHDSRYWTKTALAASTGSIINWNNLFNVPALTPANAEYVVVSLSGSLSNERVLTAGSGLNITDGGANGNITLDVVDNSTIQKINVQDNGSAIGTRSTINFVTPVSGNISYTITDDSINDRIDVEIDLASAITLNLDDLFDVDVPTPTDGQVLTYNLSTNNWEAVTPSVAPVDSVNGQTGVVILNVSDINDTAINPGSFPGPGTGAPYTPGTNILAYDDDISKWINIPASSLLAGISGIYLDDILDVEVTTAVSDLDLLYYDFSISQWVNGTANDAGLYTQTQLNTSGAGGIVHWDNIIAVPGFAPTSHTHYLYELLDVQDYSMSLPVGGEVLQWNSGLSIWEPASIPAGFSPVINNVSTLGTYTSAQDQSLTISSVNALKFQSDAGIILETDISDNIVKIGASVDNITIGLNTAGEIELIGYPAPEVDGITIGLNTAGELVALDRNVIEHTISSDKTIDEKDMYLIWGDLTIDPGVTVENAGRIVIVNGDFNNYGAYNQDITGSLEIVSTRLIYVLNQGNTTWGQHMFWTDAADAWSTGDSIIEIDAQNDNVYVTKEWVNSSILSAISDSKIKHFIRNDRTIDEDDMYLIWGDIEIDSGITLNNDGRLVVVNGNFINNGTYSQGITGSLEIVSTSLSYILSEGTTTWGQHMYWTDSVDLWSPGDSTTAINLEADNVYVTKEWVQAEIASGKAVATFTPGTVGVANTIVHNLGTADIIVQLWDVTTGAVIIADIDNVTTTNVDITFSANPSGDVKAVII